MPAQPEIDLEVMYTTWVACNRNGTEASKRLGMNNNTFRYHVKKWGFTERYNAEFSGHAEAVRKMAIINTMVQLQEMIDVLVGIAKDEENRPLERVAAVREFLRLLPPEPSTNQNQDILEANYVSVSPEHSANPEDQIREALEANIIDAHEKRSRRKT